MQYLIDNEQVVLVTLFVKASLRITNHYLFKSKTSCFGIVETIFTTRKAMLLLTKTTCFAIVMDSDAFAKLYSATAALLLIVSYRPS